MVHVRDKPRSEYVNPIHSVLLQKMNTWHTSCEANSIKQMNIKCNKQLTSAGMHVQLDVETLCTA